MIVASCPQRGLADLPRLAEEAGIEDPSDEDLRRFDKDRGKKREKKVSNAAWQSPADPDSRIAKMKDGRTHLAYKAEDVVDLQSKLLLKAPYCYGFTGD